jgi:peptidyl-tRNA hydrolase, PTH1 family
MKYLIAGLGNIGSEYAHTRHNVGFDVLDALAGASNISFEDGRYGFTTTYKFKGKSLLLLKPSTFVNLSGKAIDYWLKKHKIPLENLLVVVDDLALPYGVLRLKPRGGDAGHNGLINITEVLGTSNFARLRFGIGDDFPKGYQVDFVLSRFSPEEKTTLPDRILLAGDIIRSFATSGVEVTMNVYNNK